MTTTPARVHQDLAVHALPQGAPIGVAQRTAFNPAVNGFQFTNDFKNVFGPVQTSGLCGGMSYSALDYFNAGKTIPQQSYRPEENTPLQSYIYGRQETSIENNASQWGSWAINPGGVNNTAIAANTFAQQIGIVQSSIDQGKPIVLGLDGTNGGGSHQVLAVGYQLGLSPQATQIFLYNPNYPGETVTLVFDTTAQVFKIAEHPNDDQWVGFFADTTYSPATPPTVPEPVYPVDGLLHELFIAVGTGTDALQNGANAALEIGLTNGTTVTLSNLNLGEKWVPSYTETVRYVLPTPLDPHAIASLVLSETGSCGPWDVTSTVVQAVGSSTWVLATGGAQHLDCGATNQALPIVQTPTTITSVNPSSALPGTSVTITGAGFGTGTNMTTVSFGGTPASASCSSSTECTAVVPAGSGTVPLSVSVGVLDVPQCVAHPPAPLQTFVATGTFSFIGASCSYTAGCGGSIDVQCTPDAAGDPIVVTANPPGGQPQTLTLSSAGWGQFIEGTTTTFTACLEKPGATSCNPPVAVTPNAIACVYGSSSGAGGGGGGGGSGYHGPSGCVGRCIQ